MGISFCQCQRWESQSDSGWWAPRRRWATSFLFLAHHTALSGIASSSAVDPLMASQTGAITSWHHRTYYYMNSNFSLGWRQGKYFQFLVTKWSTCGAQAGDNIPKQNTETEGLCLPSLPIGSWKTDEEGMVPGEGQREGRCNRGRGWCQLGCGKKYRTNGNYPSLGSLDKRNLFPSFIKSWRMPNVFERKKNFFERKFLMSCHVIIKC